MHFRAFSAFSHFTGEHDRKIIGPVRGLALVLLTSLALTSCLGGRLKVRHPEIPRDVTTLTLAGQFSIPSGGGFHRWLACRSAASRA